MYYSRGVPQEYLYGTKFKVVIENKPLTSMNSLLAGPLRNFRFKVVYEPSSTSPADYGS